MSITDARARLLTVLAACEKPVPARTVAVLLWPDSPAWSHRTRGDGTRNRAGAMGGTMPMLGARAARDAARDGHVSIEYTRHHQPLFTITRDGRDALAAFTEGAQQHG